MGKGANWAAHHGDVCEPASQRVIPIPLVENGFKVVDKYSDLAFADIKMNAGPHTELVNKIKRDDNVLHRVGDESSVIRVPFAGRL